MGGLNEGAVPDERQHRRVEVLEPPTDEVGEALACVLAAGLENVFPADGLLKVLLLEPPEEEAGNDPALGHLEGAGGDAGGVTHSCGKRSGSRPK